ASTGPLRYKWLLQFLRRPRFPSHRLWGRRTMRILCSVSLAAAWLLAFGGLVRADDQADMRALVDKAVKAAGGQAKVAKLAAVTWKAKGTLNIKDQKISLTIDSSWQGLDQCKLDLQAEVMNRTESALIVFNKGKGWLKVRDRTMDAPKEFRTFLLPDLYALRLAQTLLPLKDKACKLSPLGELKIGDRDTVGVKATRKGYPDVDIFFDKKTMLPVKCQLTF